MKQDMAWNIIRRKMKYEGEKLPFTCSKCLAAKAGTDEYVQHFIKLQNGYSLLSNLYRHAPYMAGIDEFALKHYDFREMKRLMILTDDLMTGEAAACYAILKKEELLQQYLDQEYDDGDDLIIRDLNDSENPGNVSYDVSEFHVVADLYPGSGKNSGNPYLSRLPLNLETDESYYNIIVTGLMDPTDLEIKLEALSVDSLSFQVILIPRQLLTSSALRDFCAEKNCEICEVDPLKEEYFTELLCELCTRSGITPPESEDAVRCVRKLRRTYKSFSENTILQHCLKALERMQAAGRSQMTYEDLIGEAQESSAWERMQRLQGLKEVKQALREYRALLLEEMRNPGLKDIHRHMIFFGNPGSGKTMSARIAAEIMAQAGISNGTFVEADRSDLIGEYVGQTAPLVKKKFDEARGGVLFVDEAGFFLQKESGEYVIEAMKEFIRYMENYPDVTVIFAMYEKEVDDFLGLDEGLRSRIRSLVRFEDYSSEQLIKILKDMFVERGYTITKRALDILEDHIRQCGSGFGNARGARKLAEGCITEHAIAMAEYQGTAKESCNRISFTEASKAVRRDCSFQAYGNKSSRQIGFQMERKVKRR